MFNNHCEFDPMTLQDKPIGMLHCPECGEIIIAGIPHPKIVNKTTSLNSMSIEQNLIMYLYEYVNLLTEELNEVTIYAKNQGWESSHYTKGKELRIKIKDCFKLYERKNHA